MTTMTLGLRDPFSTTVEYSCSDVVEYSRGDIRELNDLEIDYVNGGVAPLIVVGVAVAGFALGVAVGVGILWAVDNMF